jgi:hypothetical protein
MGLVVADPGPINYLMLIGDVELLPELFEKVLRKLGSESILQNPKQHRGSQPYG